MNISKNLMIKREDVLNLVFEAKKKVMSKSFDGFLALKKLAEDIMNLPVENIVTDEKLEEEE